MAAMIKYSSSGGMTTVFDYMMRSQLHSTDENLVTMPILDYAKEMLLQR